MATFTPVLSPNPFAVLTVVEVMITPPLIATSAPPAPVIPLVPAGKQWPR